MDLLGDIVEHDTLVPDLNNNNFKPSLLNNSGFPKPSTKKPSQWRQRLQKKGLSSISGVVDSNNNNNKVYENDSITNLKHFKDKNERKLDYSGLSEIEQIHQENIEILTHMSTEEREEAKQELLDNLDPKILEMLIKRSAKKYGPPDNNNNNNNNNNSIYDPVEGSMGTWVGGQHELDKETNDNNINHNNIESKNMSNSSSLKSSLKSALKPSKSNENSTLNENNNNNNNNNDKKKLRFEKEAKVIYLNQNEKVKQNSHSPSNSDSEWEDFKEIDENINNSKHSNLINSNDDIGPSFDDAIKINNLSNEEIINPNSSNSSIHFPQPTQPYEELNIDDPKFNDKLYEKYFPDLPKNPKQLEWMKPDFEPPPNEISYDSIESVRFDFKGNIINNENLQNYINENQGLYNHSKDPELPGYTLSELAHYLRSTYPGQICIASRTLGRILFKLGSLKYQIHEIGDDEKLNDIGTEGSFEIECWKLIITLKIIDLLQHYASDKEKNLSVKNYAIDALWLWKKGNGDEKIKKYSNQDK